MGLAWMVHGLGARRDVEVVRVDIDPEMQGLAIRLDWPIPIHFEIGDAAEPVPRLGQFHLILADAPGGKIFKLKRTIEALAPGGLRVVDDLHLTQHNDASLRESLALVRERLQSNDDLICAELAFSSGVIVAAKRC
jgi:hypothetical protein